MTVATDDQLYIRGASTLLASWEEYARGSAGAALRRLNGVSAAVFPYAAMKSVDRQEKIELIATWLLARSISIHCARFTHSAATSLSWVSICPATKGSLRSLPLPIAPRPIAR